MFAHVRGSSISMSDSLSLQLFLELSVSLRLSKEHSLVERNRDTFLSRLSSEIRGRVGLSLSVGRRCLSVRLLNFHTRRWRCGTWLSPLYLSRMPSTRPWVRMKSLLVMPQYFCSSVMNPISAADTADFSHPAILWKWMERSDRASAQDRTRNVELSHTSISSWCRRCWGMGPRDGAISRRSDAALDTSHIARMKDRHVTGIAGTHGTHWSESFEERMPSILVRSEAEQRDCEIETSVAGSGTLHPYSDLYWVQARWNAATAMQDRCFGWAFIFARKESMLAVAQWSTSVGNSNHTLRQRSTCADPSRMPGEMPWWVGASGPRPNRSASSSSSLSSRPSSGCTSILPKVEVMGESWCEDLLSLLAGQTLACFVV